MKLLAKDGNANRLDEFDDDYYDDDDDDVLSRFRCLT